MLLAVLGGCQAKLPVHTTVEADGSGTVEVAVGLDDEAVAKAGDLGSQLRVDDLRAAGWTVTDPTKEADGYTWVRATKPFVDGPAPRPCSTRSTVPTARSAAGR